MKFSKEIHTAVHFRLRGLAMGAEPVSGHAGICYDLSHNLPMKASGYSYVAWLVKKMGLPESPMNYDSPHWVGKRGKQRRKLAESMADFLETNVL